jgi:hypothetical protein
MKSQAVTASLQEERELLNYPVQKKGKFVSQFLEFRCYLTYPDFN